MHVAALATATALTDDTTDTALAARAADGDDAHARLPRSWPASRGPGSGHRSRLGRSFSFDGARCDRIVARVMGPLQVERERR